jgi:superfamily I DNA/RNA helicase
VRRLREIALEPPCGDAVSVSDLIMREVGDDPRRRRAAELMGILALPFGSDLAAFLDDLSLTRDSDVALEPQKVALLTLHAAKGLEFPLVFVAGCEDGLLPLDVPGLDVDVEEERRLLYVGMTRARDRLVLTGAARRTLFGRRLPGRESPFLAGIVDESLASVRTIARRPPRSRQLSLL